MVVMSKASRSPRNGWTCWSKTDSAVEVKSTIDLHPGVRDRYELPSGDLPAGRSRAAFRAELKSYRVVELHTKHAPTTKVMTDATDEMI